MSAINKELYDALIKADVPDEMATAAAQSVTENQSSIREDLINIKTCLAMVEKLQWIIVVGVVGLVIKALFT